MMPDIDGPACKRCGAANGAADRRLVHAQSDPLQVLECGRCGSILSIGGHDW